MQDEFHRDREVDTDRPAVQSSRPMAPPEQGVLGRIVWEGRGALQNPDVFHAGCARDDAF